MTTFNLWNKWFAWFPVETIDGSIAFFETVERRRLSKYHSSIYESNYLYRRAIDSDGSALSFS